MTGSTTWLLCQEIFEAISDAMGVPAARKDAAIDNRKARRANAAKIRKGKKK